MYNPSTQLPSTIPSDDDVWLSPKNLSVAQMLIHGDIDTIRDKLSNEEKHKFNDLMLTLIESTIELSKIDGSKLYDSFLPLKVGEGQLRLCFPNGLHFSNPEFKKLKEKNPTLSAMLLERIGYAAYLFFNDVKKKNELLKRIDELDKRNGIENFFINQATQNSWKELPAQEKEKQAYQDYLRHRTIEGVGSSNPHISNGRGEGNSSSSNSNISSGQQDKTSQSSGRKEPATVFTPPIVVHDPGPVAKAKDKGRRLILEDAVTQQRVQEERLKASAEEKKALDEVQKIKALEEKRQKKQNWK